MTVSAFQDAQQETVTPHLKTTSIPIKGILATTDLSEQATLALKIAARLAKQLHARLHVLYTVTPQLYVSETAALSAELHKAEIERGQEELHDYLSRIPEVHTIRHEEIVLSGQPAGAIAELVEMKGIDLVVMGSHGRSGLEKMVLGSVAEATIRQLHRPVLVVGPRSVRHRDSLKSIVLATDLPSGSLRAAQYATSIARQVQAELTVVHVLPEKANVMPEFNLAEKAAKELRQLIPRDPELVKHVQFEIADGNPAEQILRIAKHGKAGLIVMGAKESSALADHAPWATLSKVIQESHCPVLVVQRHLV